MKKTLEMLNQMQADGVIQQYAIGGAVAATFYLEPSATIDLDIFVSLNPSNSSALVSLSPIYEYLTARGGRIQSEYVVVEDWPVQFLPVSNTLEEEALAEANTVDVEGVFTRVMKAEHLIAIALRTSRGKDQSRILQFLSEKAVNLDELNNVLKAHDLLPKWQAFEKRFLND